MVGPLFEWTYCTSDEHVVVDSRSWSVWFGDSAASILIEAELTRW